MQYYKIYNSFFQPPYQPPKSPILGTYLLNKVFIKNLVHIITPYLVSLGV